MHGWSYTKHKLMFDDRSAHMNWCVHNDIYTCWVHVFFYFVKNVFVFFFNDDQWVCRFITWFYSFPHDRYWNHRKMTYQSRSSRLKSLPHHDDSIYWSAHDTFSNVTDHTRPISRQSVGHHRNYIDPWDLENYAYIQRCVFSVNLKKT